MFVGIYHAGVNEKTKQNKQCEYLSDYAAMALRIELQHSLPQNKFKIYSIHDRSYVQHL